MVSRAHIAHQPKHKEKKTQEWTIKTSYESEQTTMNTHKKKQHRTVKSMKSIPSLFFLSLSLINFVFQTYYYFIYGFLIVYVRCVQFDLYVATQFILLVYFFVLLWLTKDQICCSFELPVFLNIYFGNREADIQCFFPQKKWACLEKRRRRRKKNVWNEKNYNQTQFKIHRKKKNRKKQKNKI